MTLPRLLLVTDGRATRGRDLAAVVAEAIRGGLRFVQLREKDLDDDELFELGAKICGAMPGSGVVSVNGRPGVASRLHAGLHLPAAFGPAAGLSARPLGRSVHGPSELASALAEGADYVVAGHVYETASKPGLPPRGVSWLHETCREAGDVPVFAIGGIDRGRIRHVMRAGAYGVAVCGAVLRAGDAGRAVRELESEIEKSGGGAG